MSALDGALVTFRDLLLERRVIEAWTQPSALAGYTVGGIAGHVLSLLVGLQMRLDSDLVDVDVDIIPYQDWYGAASLGSTDDQLHTELIRLGEKFASPGPNRVRADLDDVRRELVHQLCVESRDRTIPLASVPRVGVALGDYLRTRFVEITVHADDIASSAGLRCPTFPEAAWALAESVVAETTGVSGTGAGHVIGMWRPGRTTGDKDP
jgi:hypothetical protein